MLNWPAGGELLVPGLKAAVKKCAVLATGRRLAADTRKGTLAISIPALPPEEPITVIALDLDGAVKAQPGMFCVYPDLPNLFHAPFATLTDCAHTKKGWMEKFGDWHHAEVVHQLKAGSVIEWPFKALDKGLFNLHLEYDCLPEADDSELEVSVGDSVFAFPVFCTGNGHANRRRFRTENLGVVTIRKAGPAVLRIRVLDCGGENAMLIAGVTLEPIR